MLAISHATVYTPVEQLEDQTILMEEGRIQAIGPSASLPVPQGAQTMEAAGKIAAPGLVDIQFNGAFGLDFTDQPETIWEVAAGLPRYGVTAFLPTIVTAPPQQALRALEVLQQGAPPGWRGAWPLGLHVEGPFLNPEKKGAHNPSYLRPPDPALVAGFSRQAGVWLYTLAPELPGAGDLIRSLSERGVVLSAGHSLATYEQARQAFDLGVRCGTHLFNAMPPLHHTQPGLVGALLDDQRLCFGLIADGIHVHPLLVRLAWLAAGPERLILVTDAMAALGVAPGRYQIGGLEVIADGRSARLPNGTLAGSVLSLDAAVRNLMAFTGCSLSQALTSATLTPARLLGVADYLGQLRPGWQADVVLLDQALNVAATIVRGEVLFRAQEMQ